MSDIPADLRFAQSHEWARLEADGTVTVGISDHAQEALGDVVFVELAEVGKTFAAEDQAGVVDSKPRLISTHRWRAKSLR
jgi:glycine cleavage system H protein